MMENLEKDNKESNIIITLLKIDSKDDQQIKKLTIISLEIWRKTI